MGARGSAWLLCGALAVMIVGGCDDRRNRTREYYRNRTRAAQPEPVEPPPPPPPVAVAPPAVIPPPPPVVAPPPPPVPRRPSPPKEIPCGPGAGPRFVVDGVAAGDALNVRSAPDPNSDVLGQLAPDATGVLSLGPVRRVGSAQWRKVRCGALLGWANDRFLTPSR